jgi:hypothetical protein
LKHDSVLSVLGVEQGEVIWKKILIYKNVCDIWKLQQIPNIILVKRFTLVTSIKLFGEIRTYCDMYTFVVVVSSCCTHFADITYSLVNKINSLMHALFCLFSYI